MATDDRQKFWPVPPLPKWEIAIYFLIWICHSIFGLHRVCSASVLYWYLIENIFEVGWSALRGGWKDGANAEWEMYLHLLQYWIFWAIGHLILFNFLPIFLSDKYCKPIFIFYWLLAHLHLFELSEMSFVMAGSLLCLVVVKLFKNILPIWALVIYFLFNLIDVIIFQNVDIEFRAVLLYTYKTAHIINFCLAYIADPELQGKPFHLLCVDFLYYAFYFPYSNLLIVLYDDFQIQLQNRTVKPRSLFKLFFLLCRLVFWGIFTETLLHWVYINTFITDANVLRKIDLVTLLSIAYVAGIFFHLKYTVMFGVPSWFAKADNMVPPGPPICISRVSLYSRMWRYFDRGLYQFLKVQVYIPLIGPNFSNGRKILAVFVSFGFVFAWHGTETKYTRWILMNLTEILIEMVAWSLYTLEPFKNYLDKFNQAMIRRMVAMLQNVCTALGIFGTFHFLGMEGVGFVYEDLIWKHVPNVTLPFLYIISLGYVYNNVCMEIEVWERKWKIGEEKKKTQ